MTYDDVCQVGCSTRVFPRTYHMLTCSSFTPLGSSHVAFLRHQSTVVGVVLRLDCVLTCKRTFQFSARHAPRFTHTCAQGLRTQKAEASTVIALPPNHYKYSCLTDIIFKHDPTGSGNGTATQPDWVRTLKITGLGY